MEKQQNNNGGKTTKYFKLERGARQGNPISAYLFILVLEIFLDINFYIPLMQMTLLSFSKIENL